MKPIATFFCDDARYEANGKVMLIGIYAGEMTVRKFPMAAKLVPVVIFSEPRGEFPLNVSFKSAGGAIFGRGKLQLDFANKDASIAVVPLPPVNLTLSGPDVFEFALDDEVIGSLRVTLNPTPATPPSAKSRAPRAK